MKSIFQSKIQQKKSRAVKIYQRGKKRFSELLSDEAGGERIRENTELVSSDDRINIHGHGGSLLPVGSLVLLLHPEIGKNGQLE